MKELRGKIGSEPDRLEENLMALKEVQEKWHAVRVKLGRERED